MIARIVPVAMMGAVFGTALMAAASDQSPMRGVDNPARARTNYILKCQGCHRPDAGETLKATPALAGFMGRFLTVPGGRAYLVRVPGVAMSPLNDAELAEVLNWSLGTFDRANLPADFRPYSAAEVARSRQAPLRADAAAVRAGLVSRMTPNK